MASMTRKMGLREAHKQAQEMIADHVARETGEEFSVYVLRRDGDTDVFRAVPAIHGGFGMFRTKTAGWVTLGQHIDPPSTPCLVWS